MIQATIMLAICYMAYGAGLASGLLYNRHYEWKWIGEPAPQKAQKTLFLMVFWPMMYTT